MDDEKNTIQKAIEIYELLKVTNGEPPKSMGEHEIKAQINYLLMREVSDTAILGFSWKKIKEEHKIEKRYEKETTDKNAVSFAIIGDKLYEQYYVPLTNEVGFITLNSSGAPVKFKSGDLNELIPIVDELLLKRVVKLPSDALEYNTDNDLIKDIESYLNKYIDAEPMFIKICTYYIIMTWIYDRLNTVPYLSFMGDYGTGKSRILEAAGGLCYKPLFLNGATTPACLYRSADVWHGTCCIDEADHVVEETAKVFEQIMNLGYQRGKCILRMSQVEPGKIEAFDAFGPKVISQRSPFNDLAYKSRCFTYTTQETTRTNIPIDEDSEFYREQSSLRNKLLLWRLRNFDKIDTSTATKHLSKLQGLSGRVIQKSLAILTILKDDQLINEYIEELFVADKIARQDLVDSTEGRIVNYILEIRGDPSLADSAVSPAQIAGKYNDGLVKIEQITAAKVGRILQSLKLKTESITVNGQTIRNVVGERSVWINLVKRYVGAEYDKTKYKSYTEFLEANVDILMKSQKSKSVSRPLDYVAEDKY